MALGLALALMACGSKTTTTTVSTTTQGQITKPSSVLQYAQGGPLEKVDLMNQSKAFVGKSA